MLHKQRVWNTPVEVETVEELHEQLTEHTWTACTAFRWRSLVFVNDSTGPDGAQEYAVLRLDVGVGAGEKPAAGSATVLQWRQVESVTVSWGITLDGLKEIVEELDRDPHEYWKRW